MPVGWGVVGATGFARHRTIPEGIVAAQNASLIAIMSRNEASIREASEALGGVRCYTSSQELYRDPEVDAVYICTPNDSHLREAMKAAEHGKHVFCEKPLALDDQEAEQMVRTCADHCVKLGVAFMMRFHPLHLKLKSMIDAGELGTIISARVQFGWWFPAREGVWRHNPRIGGGPLWDVGSHGMDLLEFLLGPATELSCFVDTLVQDILVEDTAVVMLKFDRGSIGIVDVYFTTPVRNEFPLEVHGSRGSAFVSGSIGQLSTGKLIVKLLPDGSDDLSQIAEREVSPDTWNNMYQSEFEAFSSAIANNTPPPVGGETGLRNMRLLQAAYQAARAGRAMNV